MDIQPILNNERREKLKDMGKALLAFAAVALAPTVSNASLYFRPKSNTGVNSLVLDNSGNASVATNLSVGGNSTITGYVGIGGAVNTSYRLLVNGATYISSHAYVYGNVVGNGGSISGYTAGVYNALWNDLVEFRPLKQGEKKIPGKCYVLTENGLVASTKHAQIGTIGICSDTGGFFLGGDKNEKDKIPIGISGWVLAYVDKKYPVGTALVSGKDGNLTKANFLDKILYPERIVGVVETSPNEYNNLKIDGRYWVKIK